MPGTGSGVSERGGGFWGYSGDFAPSEGTSRSSCQELCTGIKTAVKRILMMKGKEGVVGDSGTLTTRNELFTELVRF